MKSVPRDHFSLGTPFVHTVTFVYHHISGKFLENGLAIISCLSLSLFTHWSELIYRSLSIASESSQRVPSTFQVIVKGSVTHFYSLSVFSCTRCQVHFQWFVPRLVPSCSLCHSPSHAQGSPLVGCDLGDGWSFVPLVAWCLSHMQRVHWENQDAFCGQGTLSTSKNGLRYISRISLRLTSR